MASIAPSRPGLADGRRFAERRRLVWLLACGLLWSVIVIVTELPPLLEPHPGIRQFGIAIAYQAVSWTISGALLAVLIWWTTRGRSPWAHMALALASFVVLVLGMHLVAQRVIAVSVPVSPRPQGPMDPFVFEPAFWYASWLCVVYGGTAMLLYALRRRMDQTTSALRAMALARERNEVAMTEAEVRATVERIEPRFLLEVMEAARRRYETNPQDGEAVLNACTEFLRTAMPQIRTGRSTLGGELALVEAWLALRDRLDGRSRAWHIEAVEASHASLPLPPMTLLPIVERARDCQSRAPDATPLAVLSSACDAAIGIRVCYRGRDPDDPSWLSALNRRLGLACGSGASVETGGQDAGRQVITLEVPLVSTLHSKEPR